MIPDLPKSPPLKERRMDKDDGDPSPLCRFKTEIDVVHDVLQTPWGVHILGNGWK